MLQRRGLCSSTVSTRTYKISRREKLTRPVFYHWPPSLTTRTVPRSLYATLHCECVTRAATCAACNRFVLFTISYGVPKYRNTPSTHSFAPPVYGQDCHRADRQLRNGRGSAECVRERKSPSGFQRKPRKSLDRSKSLRMQKLNVNYTNYKMPLTFKLMDECKPARQIGLIRSNVI